MVIADHLDTYGKGAWIALAVLGFLTFWPVGVATIVFMTCSGRMGAWAPSSRGNWAEMRSGCGFGGGWHNRHRRGRDRRPTDSGNVAFDEYRLETLRRLEQEQGEFVEYLDRLRAAKDKAEFEQFMAERRARPVEA